jgi:hypothetical protein
MKPTRFSVLRDLILEHRWTRGVELGVWQGDLFGYLLENFPHLRLVGVDTWEPVGPYAGKDMQAARRKAAAIRWKHGDRATLLCCDTVLAAVAIVEPVDFVFIDASHDEKSVAADVEAWLPKLSDNGRLCGHDANLPSVRAALDRTLPGWRRVEANCWVGPRAVV